MRNSLLGIFQGNFPRIHKEIFFSGIQNTSHHIFINISSKAIFWVVLKQVDCKKNKAVIPYTVFLLCLESNVLNDVGKPGVWEWNSEIRNVFVTEKVRSRNWSTISKYNRAAFSFFKEKRWKMLFILLVIENNTVTTTC